MRKILLSMMSFVTALSLTACSAGGNANSSNVSQTSTSTSGSISAATGSQQNPSTVPSEQSTESSQQTASNSDEQKTLIVYYSLTGTTKAAAVMVEQSAGGDMFEIKVVEDYPTAHDDTTVRVDKDRSENKLPELSTKIENINDYDRIFIGYPIWRSKFADPIAAFLKEYDLSSKTIIPFSTSGSGTLGTSVEDLKELEPNATVLEGLAVPGSNAQKAITDWISKLGISK